MEKQNQRIYATTLTSKNNDFTSYLMAVGVITEEVVYVSIAEYSQEKRKYYSKNAKHPQEEGFEEMQQEVVKWLKTNDSEMKDMRRNDPQLYAKFMGKS